jgi:hypothetical protein
LQKLLIRPKINVFGKYQKWYQKAEVKADNKSGEKVGK